VLENESGQDDVGFLANLMEDYGGGVQSVELVE